MPSNEDSITFCKMYLNQVSVLDLSIFSAALHLDYAGTVDENLYGVIIVPAI